MKRKFLICIWVFTLMTFAASGAYACSDSPIADLNLSAHYDPVAKRYYIPVGDTLTLDGRGSCDPDEGDPILICTHYIKKFYWNFGDGSIDYYEMPTYYPDGLFEGGTTHTYNAPMICTPTLTVTDNDAAEGHPPDKSDPCSCSLAVVKVDVDMEGVAEEKEINPGGYVPVNEDDDNDNGIADKDDVGQVNGEDNLVAISLSISPPYPILNEGEIKLTTTATAGQLRVWSHPDKQNLIIPNGDPPKYYATWTPQNLPTTLYVEGITPVLPGAELLTLSYAIGPAGIDADKISVTVIGVELYRSGGVLDDWPKTGNLLRSPKYIFGKTDPISVQVNSLDRNPIQETFLDYVKVTSTSAGEQYLNMYYAGNHWYNNWVYPGELLYLATDNQPGDGDNIKVVDEEVLTFWLEIQPASGSYRSCKTVMVDKGEYAWFGIHQFRADGPEFKGEMEDLRVNWWEAGYLEYPDDCGDTMRSPIIRAGQNFSAILESDFMLVSCHGATNGDLLDNNKPDKNLIMHPSDISNASGWNNDVEWVWLLACDILNVAGGGRNAWDDALFGSPRPAHMILGYHEIVGGNQTGEIENFFDYAAGQNDTIVSSFYHACTDGWNDPGAIVEHKDNDDDKLKYVTRDTSSTNLRYYWLAGTWQYTDYTRGAAEQTQTRVYGNCQIELPGSLPDLRPELAPLEVELLALKSSPKGFNQFKRTYGLEVFWKPIAHEQILGQDEQMARDIAQLALDDIIGETARSDDLVPGDSTFYAVDFERGDTPDISAGIPLVRAIEYYHNYRGIAIEGDILSAAVAGDKIVKVRACWHKIVREQDEQKKEVVDVEDSLAVSTQSIVQKFPSEKDLRFTLRGAKLCYYGFHDAGKTKKLFLPAWHFTFEKDGRLYNQYVNAHNNKPISFEQDIVNARRKQR